MKTIVFFLAAASAGCGMAGIGSGKTRTPFNVSNTLPSTQGTVAVSGPSKNGNRSLSIQLSCLPSPARLVPPAPDYVVWVQNTLVRGAPAENVGEIVENSRLDASFNTITPLQQFTVWITTETSPQVSTPSGPGLLWATVTP